MTIVFSCEFLLLTIKFYIWYMMFYSIKIQYVSPCKFLNWFLQHHNFLLFIYIKERSCYVIALYYYQKFWFHKWSTESRLQKWFDTIVHTVPEGQRFQWCRVPTKLYVYDMSTSCMLWEEKSFFNFTFFSVNHPWKKPIFEGHQSSQATLE